MKADFKTIALVGKFNSPACTGSVLRLADFLGKRGYQVMLTAHAADACELRDYPVASLREIGGRVDLAIVMGGDGTLLNIARSLADSQVPLIGVNQGRLGFLADVSIDTMFTTLEEMLAGEYVAEERIMLEARVERADDARAGSPPGCPEGFLPPSGGGADLREEPGAVLIASYAFNDVVVSKSTMGRLIEFEVYIDDQFVYSQRADGLVVASPTGSTAYALSAGGPILHPTLEAVVLAPICPHTLSARPIAVHSRSWIEINLIHASDARVHFDGQLHADLVVGDRVGIRRAGKTVHLLHPQGHSYYDTLRQKLHWGEKL